MDSNNNPDYVVRNLNGSFSIRDYSSSADRFTISSGGQANVYNNLNVENTNPKIFLTDTDHNSDFSIRNTDGTLIFYDETNSANRFLIHSSGTGTFNGNLNVDSGLDVTGNITVTGTVDGVDVAALNTTVGNLGISNGSIASGTTAVTQGQSANNTQIATTSFVKTAIANLVDSSPSSLDTLNELAAAIGDDANFSTTVTNSIATKMPKSGGEFTGNLTVENITPDGDSSRNLGTNSVRFANVYADNFVGSGANLTGVEAFVSGMIILWSGNTGNIPSGFVLCNGSNSTPDLRDRFVVGAGSSYNPGSTGGSNSVTLSTTQIPSHNHTTPNHRHSFSGSTNNDTHSHTWDRQDAANDQGYRPWPASNNDCRRTTANTGNDTHNHSFSGNTGYHQGTTTSTGSGSSHENRPPYYALCYIMKT